MTKLENALQLKEEIGLSADFKNEIKEILKQL